MSLPDLETLRRRRDESAAARKAELERVTQAALSSEQPVDQLPVLQQRAYEIHDKLELLRSAQEAAPGELARNAIGVDIDSLEKQLEETNKAIEAWVEAAQLNAQIAQNEKAVEQMKETNKPIEERPATASAKFVA